MSHPRDAACVMKVPVDVPVSARPPRRAFRLPGGLRRLRLTGWFALLSLLCIGIVSIVSSVLLSRFLTANLLEHDASTMMEVVQGLVDVQDARGYFVNGASARDTGKFEEFFAHVAKLPDVLRANIYATDQRVLWSSDPALIGQKLGPNEELEEALKGRVEIETGVIGPSDPKPEHLRLKSREPRFVENYLPVRAERDGPVIGVVELYRVPTALFDAIGRGLRLVWVSALAGGVLLYAVLYGLVRRADRLIEEQSARLLETETLAVVGEMTGAITHGIRNPLASIRTSAELLEGDGSPDARNAARDIVAEVDRLSEWVRQLLTYSDQQAPLITAVDVPSIVQGCVQGYGRELERRGVQATVHVEPNVPSAAAEAMRLSHVFNSLVANALEAMPSGGALRISVASDRDNVVTTFSDTGTGVAPDVLPRVFAPFFTTKRKGLGLGLPLVRRIVDRFGGSVSLASEVGRGTIVTVSLPAIA